MTTTQSTTAFM